MKGKDFLDIAIMFTVVVAAVVVANKVILPWLSDKKTTA